MVPPNRFQLRAVRKYDMTQIIITKKIKGIFLEVLGVAEHVAIAK